MKRVGSLFKRSGESLEVCKLRQKSLAAELPDRSYLTEDDRPYLKIGLVNCYTYQRGKERFPEGHGFSEGGFLDSDQWDCGENEIQENEMSSIVMCYV